MALSLVYHASCKQRDVITAHFSLHLTFLQSVNIKSYMCNWKGQQWWWGGQQWRSPQCWWTI